VALNYYVQAKHYDRSREPSFPHRHICHFHLDRFSHQPHLLSSSGKKDEGIIKVILELGRTLGLKVVAEGVETLEQLTFLKDNACKEIQGFYFYRPITAQEVAEVLPKQ